MKSLIGNYLDSFSKYIDLYSSIYEKVIILGDFDRYIEE